MQTMIITSFGDTQVFQNQSISMPQIAPNQVLIKVMATSVNPLDYKLRQGIFPDLIPQFPAILHGDVAGVVTEIGANVTQFAVGDEVYGCVGGFLDMPGALAEYLAADSNLIAHKPKTLSFREAAALPLVSLTAWEGIISYANLQSGQSILIHGGTGGVGHIAIQLAKWKGAKVFSTSSSEKKMALAENMGADVTINYQTMDASTYLSKYTDNQGFDVVFDTVGGPTLSQAFTEAKIFGSVISILGVGNYDLTPAFLKGLSIHLVMQPLPLITGLRRSHYQNILTEVAQLVDAGVIKPLIDEKRFTIQQVALAHEYLENGHAVGKVVLEGFH